MCILRTPASIDINRRLAPNGEDTGRHAEPLPEQMEASRTVRPHCFREAICRALGALATAALLSLQRRRQLAATTTTTTREVGAG